jgi:hypothetical protein
MHACKHDFSVQTTKTDLHIKRIYKDLNHKHHNRYINQLNKFNHPDTRYSLNLTPVKNFLARVSYLQLNIVDSLFFISQNGPEFETQYMQLTHTKRPHRFPKVIRKMSDAGLIFYI